MSESYPLSTMSHSHVDSEIGLSRNSSVRGMRQGIDEHNNYYAERAWRYADHIAARANHGQNRYLFCGSHFRALCELVSKSAPNNPKKPLEFDYVVCCDFSGVSVGTESARRQIQTFDTTASGLDSFASLTDPAPQTTRVLFLRGHPSAEWIKVLGAQQRIEFEYFRQKLPFLDKDYHDIPALPSNSQNIFHLNIMTVYKRHRALRWSQVDKLRKAEKKAVSKYQRSQSYVGDSIVRRVCIFDESEFAIEQDISICIVNQRGRGKTGKTAIVWLDSGRELCHDSEAPWECPLNPGYITPNNALPTIRHIPSKILASMSRLEPSVLGPERPTCSQDTCLPPSAEHLPYQYGLTLDPVIASNDLLYALSELLFFVACNEVQFLNLIEQRIATLMDGFKGYESIVLEELNYAMRLLQSRARHIADTQALLENSGSVLRNGGDRRGRRSRAPSMSDDQNSCRCSEALHAESLLVEDFAYLARRATALITQARDGMTVVSNTVMLEESRRAISKTVRLEKLTLLTFFFLPLSLTTSFFGCNFRELGGTGQLSIWVMFLTLLPVMSLTAVLCFWDHISAIEWTRKLRLSKN
ncbi:uncharacterized protein F4822DRAFT_397070 [Hypoxylon trugodes]|uniref:uncharacterized protein n=1 Tax=Hypoxylon trugodes TaxID=326681 RepID=UPI0021943EC1|nr:uncharacterized protein F4822DRAFT_397070 [Hypoxylon trugodes]KAI1391551.1 hypothetical protein F4822DRAFT_397070 [Hypoxylon trugodes]